MNETAVCDSYIFCRMTQAVITSCHKLDFGPLTIDYSLIEHRQLA